MSMHGVPGAVVPFSSNTVKQAAKRAGLMRMTVGSQHAIRLATGITHTVARDWQDCPGVKAVHLCLHPRCEGKTWGSYDEMRKSHPETKQMVAGGEAHVYGMWSADTLDPEALAAATKAHAAAVKELAEVKKLAVNTLADKEMVKEYAAVVDAAAAELAKHQVCVGLISPPEQRWDD